MKEVVSTTQFRKDFRRYQLFPDKLKKLLLVIQLLENEEPIPLHYKPHLLKGNYKGYMECHIENDFLLIWIDESSSVVKLIRLGSHSELFR